MSAVRRLVATVCGGYPHRKSVLLMLDYRRTWLVSTLRNLSAVAIGIAFVAVMVFVGFQIPFDSRTEFICFVAGSSAIGLALTFEFAKHLDWDLASRRDFRFRVTKSFIECECPAPALGDSFRLLFEDISEVRIVNDSGGSDRFVILDHSDQEYVVSGAHGIPVYQALNAIRDVSPSTCITEYGRPWGARPAIVHPVAKSGQPRNSHDTQRSTNAN